MWGFDFRMSIEADIPPSLVVSHDEHHIGPGGLTIQNQKNRKEKK
jgi:hypothetical protein